MAKVLLTGASGFVGGHLLRELLGHGHQVSALSRSESSDKPIQSAGAPCLASNEDKMAVVVHDIPMTPHFSV